MAIALSFGRPAAAEGDALPDPLVPTESSLRALAEDLRAGNEGARVGAFEALSTLPESAIPAIEQRFRQMRREAVRGEDGYEILRAFAHAIGSQDASEPVDIAPGVAPVLRGGRSLARARVAERLALLRSLERIGTARAMVAMLALFAHDFEAFRWEARHIVTRVGKRAGPALLRAAAMTGTSLEVWGKWGQRALGIDDPTSMLAGQDEASVVEVLRAYAAVRHMGGMTAVADFVDDPREPVRRAAREAMEEYGQNGVWQLRRVMEQQLGQEPDLDASWQETMRALYAGLDARRLAPLYDALDGALARASAGGLDEAARALDALLARAPELPRRAEAAPVYAALGDSRLGAERWDEARRAYDRALWLDGSHPRAVEWRASRALAEAELTIAVGAPEAALLQSALASPTARARAEARLEGDTPEPIVTEAPAPLRERVPPEALVALGVLLLGWPLLGRAARVGAGPARALAGRALRVVVAGSTSRLAGARSAWTTVRARIELRARATRAARTEAARARADAPIALDAPAARALADAPAARALADAPAARALADAPAALDAPRALSRTEAPVGMDVPDSAPRVDAAARPTAREGRLAERPNTPARAKRPKPARAVLPADLLFGGATARSDASLSAKTRPPTARRAAVPTPLAAEIATVDPALTTSPGAIPALDTLPG